MLPSQPLSALWSNGLIQPHDYFFFFFFFFFFLGSFRLSLFFLCSFYVCVCVFYFERENHKSKICVWLFGVALNRFGWVGFGSALAVSSCGLSVAVVGHGRRGDHGVVVGVGL